MKIKAWTRYKTRCGFVAEVYRVTASHYAESSGYGNAIGAVLIPPHPAALPGWMPREWHDIGGGVYGEGREGRQHPHDLIEELGPMGVPT